MSFVARFSNPFRFALLLAVVWGAAGLQPEGAEGVQLLSLSTAFTYQGQLQQSGMPATATCDFQFTLFDQAGSGSPPTGGTSQGCVVQNGVSVTNGLFTVPLDFGSSPNPFTGSDRWLQLAVCCGGGCPSATCPTVGGSYVTLSPRQQLTATPYALYAPSAGSASNLSCSGCVTTGTLAPGAVTGSVIASGTIQASNLGFTPVLSVGASSPLTSSGGQNPSISLSGTVPLANGGTGATTSNAARGNLGAAASGANLDITSLSGITGNISLPESTSMSVGNILKGVNPFIHNFGIYNTFVGESAGNFSMTGQQNTAVGQAALSVNQYGTNNVAVGFEALFKSGNDPVYQGGNLNTALGSQALLNNTSGGLNIAIGYEAGMNLTTGANNIDIGNGGVASDGVFPSPGVIRIGSSVQGSTFIGGIDGSTTPGGTVVFVKSNGQLGTATGATNVALGDDALSTTTGGNNTAVGQHALQANSSGGANTAVGQAALSSNMGGNANTALGQNALQKSNSHNNTAVGQGALKCNTGSNSTDNTAVGEEALDADAAGCTDGGVHNTAVGRLALANNSGGYENVAVGWSALPLNTSGYDNTALGVAALHNNLSGYDNVAVGLSALYNSSGTENTAVGWNALNNVVGGSNNIAVGYQAGTNLTGSDADNIDIGNPGVAGESDTIRIGDTNAFNDVSAKTFIAGVYNPTVADRIVYVSSTGQFGTESSSARFKDDIEDMGNSTSILLKLRPVRFRYKKDIDPSGVEQYGLVAEEVAKVYPDLVSNDAAGRPYTVRYQFLAPMLLNEVQKQARQLTTQAHRIAQLTEQTQQATEQTRQISEQSRQLSDQAQQIAALQKQVEELGTLKAETAALKARVDALDTPQTVANRRSSRARDARPAAF